MELNSKIYVAGHRGLVGSAIVRKLKSMGYNNLVVRTHKELDLTIQKDVNTFFESEKPEYVFLAAAKVGGIGANSTYVADFIYQNITIATNVIHASYKSGVKKLLNMGSSCIYPKLAPQPLKEEYLLSDYLEPTNEAYAIAKISAIKMCRYYNEQYGTNYISAMPTNLYGPGDNYDLQGSHVLPAIIRKVYEAKESNSDITLWGDGSALREFLYSEDLAEALIYLMENKDYSEIGEFINVGSSEEISIKDLAELVKEVVGYNGKINWDITKPNGTPRKLMDNSRINNLGWKSTTNLKDGIASALQDFIKRYK